MFAGYGIRSMALGLIGLAGLCTPAFAGPYLLIEAHTGKVVAEQDAGKPWHPASVTKLMTTYVTFRAMREGRINPYTLFTVSPYAAATPPSKVGFKAGTQVTVDNALKLLMVKSANDMAVVIAEGVSGSVPDFVAEMNLTAQRLGMNATRFANPHGLPDETQITTARDMAVLAQAIINEFPEHEMLFRIPALRVGKRLLRNYNRLIDRYPGADGMKTGFICASGFNLVASAHRGNKRLIVVVFGSMSAKYRAEEAAMLFERGFQTGAGLEILLGGSKQVTAIQNIAQDPTNLYELMCGKERKNRFAAMSDAGDEHEEGENGANDTNADPLRAFRKNKESLLVDLPASMQPIRVYTGPARDSKGRVIRIAGTPNGANDVEPEEEKPRATKTASVFAPFPPGFGPQNVEPVAALSAKPIKLPRRVPMPVRRPRI